ncbi:MAG: RNA polymerase sigma-54 factor, partial [Muribaculaceae bacterium]|nr:RNA polymerase sigma-54 factor [Muribaculaceae bacterium]
PMVLRQIADETGLDLTLISRAVAGKWMATQWGVYSLKSFFNHRTGAGDTDPSAREICAALREIIDAEPADAPLSDEALAEALAGRGYKVARRTVAKYRTRLNIAPARLRRK